METGWVGNPLGGSRARVCRLGRRCGRLGWRAGLGRWGCVSGSRDLSAPSGPSGSPCWLVRRMQGAGKALHELLLSAQRQGCLTAGVYESAKVLNV